MQFPFPMLASGDSWIGFVIFIIIAIASSVSKMMQKGQEPEMPEEWPQPQPPHRPPVIVQQPHRPQQRSQRALTEQQVQEVLRRMRKGAPAQVPPSVVVADESLPRRLVKLEREEAELPSRHLEQALHEEELPSVHREETARETTPPSAQPPVAAPARAPVIGLRASVYRAQLCSRADARHAIVLRELLGPPLALRQDW